VCLRYALFIAAVIHSMPVGLVVSALAVALEPSLMDLLPHRRSHLLVQHGFSSCNSVALRLFTD
jgi:hypothetical protein